jgi:LPS-assembly protein
MRQMKHQFKFNPLATAILTLLCGSSVTSFASSADSAQTSTTNAQLKAAINEAYPGQKFFEQYYVDKSAPEAQQRKYSSSFCQGTWITPIDPSIKPADTNNSDSTVTADYGHYNPNGDSILEGNVVIEQPGRLIHANEVTIDKTQTYANAKGNVQMAQGGLISQSDQINYNLKTQQGDLSNSLYISETQHAHGRAEKIARTSTNTTILNNASYTTCPPNQVPTWKVQAKEIILNQETGRGETKNAKLYVKDVPVLAVPYFNFPIDDRRTTGILTPSFGFTNNGGLELGVPVYLNLAPNYDATITPRYIADRGLMMSGQFRYLTENYGGGHFSGGFLGSDKKYDNKDRKEFHFDHLWQINKQFSTAAVYNYASDKDYFSDLETGPDSRTDLNLRRAWELNYNNGIPGLKAKLKVEDFQTLDTEIADIDRPYARLPQFLLNYKKGNPQGFQVEFNNDTAYFKKDISSFLPNEKVQPSGTRVYNDFTVRYNYSNEWSYIRPAASIRNINTFFDQDTKDRYNTSENISVTVPLFTLDAGLLFEKDGKYLQTLSPRVFYAYAPYKNQLGNPNFDSVVASIGYDQLFSANRFYGHDRLEDNNFATLGLSYSIFGPEGFERLRASVGQSFYFEDRRVVLDDTYDRYDKEKRSGPAVSLSSQLSQNWNVSANSLWLPSGQNAQTDINAFYNADNGALYSLGYIYRKDLVDRQSSYDQVIASFVQPIHNNWRLLGHAQYDLDNKVTRDMLLGINYESCCWGLSVYGRSYYNDLDNVNAAGVKPKRAIMAEITFRGLGGFNNKLASLLENRILGFNKVNQSWTQR